ncbi:MAG: hypothetical protein EPO22_09845 [Dehalococcoidia bacterium]|nr:MAG: hypothetical protein EPO22_09845 [Dehalococcoidia bacterium]
MSTNDRPTGIDRELTWALDELHAALQRATEATATIKGLVPRLAATGSLFDEIEALVRAGRQHIGVGDASAEAGVTRPTLVVPSAPRPAPVLQPSGSFTTPEGGSDSWAPVLDTPAPAPAETSPEEEPVQEEAAAPSVELHCFRLEFESQPGPLDLRTVDDAVSEHPAVRDVALLDYDGHRATLKVWISPDASPSDVQDALKARAASLFSAEQDVTIVALEDAA